ncbi:MAG: hypothetical protein ABR587_05185 [Candidatus Binatia bacterium]
MSDSRPMTARLEATQAEEVCKTPEARLMLAVLEEALVTFRRGVHSMVPSERQSYREVEAWLRSVENDSPFAFESICWTLQMDPDYVRAGFYQLKLESMLKKTTASVRKLRRERVYDRRVWKGHIG